MAEDGRVDASHIPSVTLVLLEDIAERLQLSQGVWRLEIDFKDGEFQYAWRHQRVNLAGLGEFDQAAGATT